MKKYKKLISFVFVFFTLFKTFGENTVHYATSENIEEIIKNLPQGKKHKVILTGKISLFSLNCIEKSLKENPKALIELDLSSTTELSYVDRRCFIDCTNLIEITLPKGITGISDSAFSGCCNLEKITIPSSVKSISVKAFFDCKSLKSITIPQNVTRISSSAFMGCTNLETVNIPQNLESMGINIFAGCTNLTQINIDKNNKYFSTSEDKKILYNKDKTDLISFPAASSKVKIPDGITKISWNAFFRCSNLTEIIIPDGVKIIERNAFYSCENLETITIPSSITEISDFAFFECNKINTVNYNGSKKQWKKINKNVSLDAKINFF